jgi:hypothetical protein
MSSLNLLSPNQLQQHYIHQLRQTIDAYDGPHIVLGEALQNALDAVIEAGGGSHTISVHLDFDKRLVSVRDDGVGFPNDPTLLFLGGSGKPGKAGLYGLVGVGMKVILFSSEFFRIRARTVQGAHAIEVREAYRFTEATPPPLVVPETFPADPDPLPSLGTEITYGFPAQGPREVWRECFQTVHSSCSPQGADDPFLKTLAAGVAKKVFPTRFAGLVASFLRRFTYVGDVQARVGGKQALAKTTIRVRVTCSDPLTVLGPQIGELFDTKTDFEFTVEPTHLLVEDVVGWGIAPKPPIFNDKLGKGGRNLQITFSGFDLLILTKPEEYEELLLDTRGHLGRETEKSIVEYRQLLFPRINCIILVIGRIPEFLRCLPGGSRRVLSANGVVTSHDLDFTKGRNQEYVRCFDLIVDVNAALNYGKTQVTDMHLVGRVRRYVNDAYRATIQNGAGQRVGKIVEDDDDNGARDVFLGRKDLGLEDALLVKEPRDENDVIGLFFELGGRGHFPEYRIFGLSQRDKYDARAAILREADDPQEVFKPEDERDLRIVEFKRIAAEIVSDFERGQKSAAEVELIVAWDEGTSAVPRYGFEDIQHSRAYNKTPKRVFPRVQRYLQDARDGHQVQVLLLKPIIEELRAKKSAAR